MAYPPNTGGVEILLRQHAITLTDFGYSVTVLTGSGEEKDSRIKLHVIPELRSLMNFAPDLQNKILEQGIIDDDFYNLAKIIEGKLDSFLEDQDAIIVHNMLSVVRNLPFTFAFKKYIEKNPQKKFITWVHDHSYIDQQKIKNLDIIVKSKFERELMITPIPNIKYITISEVFKTALKKLLNITDEQIQVIYNGINIKRFLEIDDQIWEIVQKYNLLEPFPFILQPVNLLGRKNIEYSLEIVKELLPQFPKIKLLITGNPSQHRSTLEYMQSIKKLIADLQISNSVIFLNEFFSKSLDDSALHDLYSLSDLIFYFSKSENFGLPVLEAGLSKTPIFLSNLEVFHEIGKNHVNYIDYNVVSAKEAANIIAKFISDNQNIQANKEARQKFNLKSLLEEKLLPLL